MKTRKNATSPFGMVLYLKRDEIDQMCEDALREAKLLPDKPATIKIDKFIESHFKCTLDFGTDLGTDVMGFTFFSPKGAPVVVGVSPNLCDGTKVNDRRVRTTLAHEAGHCLIHPILFMPDIDTSSLFGTNVDVKKRQILCRQQDFEGGRSYDGRWWEFQANCAIGGFLLPNRLFRTACEKYLVPVGSLGLNEIPSEKREMAARELSEVFDVNPKVVAIRLNNLFPASSQPAL
jgi:hypothetical protein